MGVEDDALIEGGDNKGGCGLSLACAPALVCLCCCFVLFGAAFYPIFEVAAADFSSFGAALVFPRFDLITGVNGVEETDANNVQLVLSIADHVATLVASGLTFFVVERLSVNSLFISNLFGVDERVYSAL